MTFYNQMVPGNPDDPDDVENVAVPLRSDVEIEWHGGPREQGGYAVARPADGSIEAVNEALGRYEQTVKAAGEGVSKPEPGKPIKSFQGTVRHDLQGMRAITVAGVQLMVDPAVFDDFELLESLAEIQRGDILALPTVFRAVAGDKAQELLDAIRGENGRVTATAATETLVQIMSGLAPKA
jgi:hypothetical protein|nr:MAG TPA: hypothetical protein [Caudoviricetes sp.]